MFGRPDHTYNDIREKSLMQWLDEMEQHPDIAVRGGVKLAREYVDHLKIRIRDKCHSHRSDNCEKYSSGID